MEMKIDYQITLADYLEAQRLCQKFGQRFIGVGGVFVMAMGVLSLFLTPNEPGVGIVCFVFGCLLAFGTRLTTTLAYQRSRRIKDTLQVLITGEFMDVQSSTAKTQYRWDAFIGWVEGKHVFVVFQEPMLFNILPKRAFQTELVDEFRNLLQTNLGSKTSDFQRKRYQGSMRTALVWAIIVAVVFGIFLLKNHNR